MIIAGIVGQNGINETSNLVNSILSSTSRKVSIVDSKNLVGLDAKRIKNYIAELGKNNVNIMVLKINVVDLEEQFFDGLRFDIIIYTDNARDPQETHVKSDGNLMGKIMSMLDDKGVIIVNEDDGELMSFLDGVKQHIVTYGFNSKASITTSSVGDTFFEDKFMCSLQKTISAKNGLLIEPQEYIIKVDSKETDSYNVLAAASFAIVNGIDLNSLVPAGLKS